jgi:uncharacterized membrane protein YraQ (UPF0718 family)
MNTKEKAGDLLIDVAKLVIGGVLLASIISENINTLILYFGGTALSAILILLGFYFYKLKSKGKEK